MEKKYHPQKIEKKWQKRWEDEQAFVAEVGEVEPVVVDYYIRGFVEVGDV